MGINFLINNKKITIALIIIFIGYFGIEKMYNHFSGCHITVKISESPPIKPEIPVYFKGCKVGELKSIKLSKDYKYSLAKIRLNDPKPNLPENTIAQVKKHNLIKQYVELVLPEEPSDKKLQNGQIISGEAGLELESLLTDIARSETLAVMIEMFSDLLSSINHTSDEMGKFFHNSDSFLNKNQNNISLTTIELKELSKKLNNSISEKELKNTTSNINESSENIKNISENIDEATEDIDEIIEKIDCILSKTNLGITNVNKITYGLHQTLKQRFAGIRIFFGKPIKQDNCTK